ncbi:hypothetical protein GCM10027614_81040 [Micromonospora vulcania]
MNAREYVPIAANRMIIGNNTWYGMRSMRTQSPMSGRFSSRSSTLPIHIDAIRPQNSAGSSSMTFGPGVMPCTMNAPTISAITGWAGSPRVSSGMNDVCAAALLADSGPATPSIAPRPNSCGRLEIRFSTAYEVNEARTWPPPGRTPSAAPRPVPRRIGPTVRRRSARVGQRFVTLLMTAVRVCSFSRFRRISATPNMPTATDTKSMPPYSSRWSKTNRGVPV